MWSAPCPRRGRSPRCGAVLLEAGGGPLRLPGADREGWPAVRDRLASRGLDPRLLGRCRRGGLLYADRRGRAVFVCRDAAGPAPHAATLLVESALEALAACQLLAASLPPGARLVSAAVPAAALPRWVRGAPPQLLV